MLLQIIKHQGDLEAREPSHVIRASLRADELRDARILEFIARLKIIISIMQVDKYVDLKWSYLFAALWIAISSTIPTSTVLPSGCWKASALRAHWPRPMAFVCCSFPHWDNGRQIYAYFFCGAFVLRLVTVRLTDWLTYWLTDSLTPLVSQIWSLLSSTASLRVCEQITASLPIGLKLPFPSFAAAAVARGFR